jgi:CTP:molybdopterin cytidylyltransferase MocA
MEESIMKKPVLVIMAAGMGSRYGGLKQIDPVDKEGHIIMDFSISMQSVRDLKKLYLSLKKRMRLILRKQSATEWKRSWMLHMHIRIFITCRKDLKFRRVV